MAAGSRRHRIRPTPRPRGALPDRSSRLAAAVLAGGIASTAAAITLVVLLADGQVRVTADSTDSVPWWTAWVAPLFALGVARGSPPRLAPSDPLVGVPRRTVAREAAWCVACAGGFTLVLGGVATATAGVGGVVFTVVKVALLLVAPLAVLRAARWSRPPGRRYAWWAMVPVAAWSAIAWFGPLAAPADAGGLPAGVAVAVATLVFLFLLNATLEEVFHRIWLQTRLERLLGRWPAIMAASLLWTSWHVIIKATGDPVVDIAGAMAYLVPCGLLLGYLWARYRSTLALLLVHGGSNAPLAMLVDVA